MSSLPKTTKLPGRMPDAPCLALWFRPLSLYLEHNSRERWRILAREYPDGGREWSITPLYERNPDRSAHAGSDAEAEAPARAVRCDPEHTRVKMASRAKRNVVRLARYQDFRHMWTPTFPGQGEHDYERAYQAISTFLHHRGALLHGGGGYLAVPELHPGGHGWHWHVLLRKGMSRGALRELQHGWSRHLSRRGYTLPPSGLVRHHLKRYASARIAGRYAGKYVAKSMGEGLEAGRQRYLRSEGLTIPEPERSRASSLPAAFGLLAHPLFWDRMYSGFAVNEPWVWISIEGPD